MRHGYDAISAFPPERIILAIDPGTAITGYAFVHEHKRLLQLLTCDVIRTPKNTALPDRLQILYEQFTTLLATYHPTESAMELLFFGKNRKAAIAVSHARGVAMLARKPGSSLHSRVHTYSN